MNSLNWWLASLCSFFYRSNRTTSPAICVVDRPDYGAFAQEVEAQASRVLPRFHGEAYDELKLIFDTLKLGLEIVDVSSRRINGGEPNALAMCVGFFMQDMPELRHYEIAQAILTRLEAMQSDLNAWAGELRARGQLPSGPAVSPPL